MSAATAADSTNALVCSSVYANRTASQSTTAVKKCPFLQAWGTILGLRGLDQRAELSTLEEIIACRQADCMGNGVVTIETLANEIEFYEIYLDQLTQASQRVSVPLELSDVNPLV